MNSINLYGLMLDRDNDCHPYLVKETSVVYEATDCFNSPPKIVDMLNECFNLQNQAEEYMYLIVLDTAGHAKGVFNLSHGTGRETMVSPREIFIRITLSAGNSFILCHNHPSGLPQPSKEDYEVCRRIKEASALMDVPLLDFVIVGYNNYLSFSREGLL